MYCSTKCSNEFHCSCTNAVADSDQDWSASSNILEELLTDWRAVKMCCHQSLHIYISLCKQCCFTIFFTRFCRYSLCHSSAVTLLYCPIKHPVFWTLMFSHIITQVHWMSITHAPTVMPSSSGCSDPCQNCQWTHSISLIQPVRMSPVLSVHMLTVTWTWCWV